MGRFGLIEPRQEGGKLWPYDYLKFNGKAPPLGFYTPKEVREFLQLEYDIEDLIAWPNT